MLEVVAAPSRLVDDAGQVTFGVFDGPVADPNLADAKIGGLVPRALRFKRWQHFALVLPECFLGVALVDVGYLGTAWVSVVERRAGGDRHQEVRWQGPRGIVRVAHALQDDRCHLHTRDLEVEIHNHLAAGEHHLQGRARGKGGTPEVTFDLRCLADPPVAPLEVCLPVGPNRGMYTHKVPLPLEGTVTVDGRTFAASPDTAWALLDVHKAHYPRRTFWRWATGAGRAGTRQVAFNLTKNVCLDDRRYNENAVWLDGRLHHVGPATFEFRKDAPLEPWRVRSEDGAVDLVFQPRGLRKEDLDVGLVKSVFRQPWGTWTGTLRVGGEVVEVAELFGVAEDHDSTW